MFTYINTDFLDMNYSEKFKFHGSSCPVLLLAGRVTDAEGIDRPESTHNDFVPNAHPVKIMLHSTQMGTRNFRDEISDFSL